MSASTAREIDTSVATALARMFDADGFGTRLVLVETLPVVVLSGCGVEIPVVFHADDLPGLLFLPYRADSMRGRLDSVLDGQQAMELRLIAISEADYRALMSAIGGGLQVVLEMFITQCCADEDRDVDNVRD